MFNKFLRRSYIKKICNEIQARTGVALGDVCRFHKKLMCPVGVGTASFISNMDGLGLQLHIIVNGEMIFSYATIDEYDFVANACYAILDCKQMYPKLVTHK